MHSFSVSSDDNEDDYEIQIEDDFEIKTEEETDFGGNF